MKMKMKNGDDETRAVRIRCRRNLGREGMGRRGWERELGGDGDGGRG